MSIKDRIAKELEKEVEGRMGPAVQAMETLGKKIDELIKSIDRNTKMLKGKK